MIKNYIVVSMFTVDTPYEQEIKHLEQSLIKYSVPYKFYPIVNTGDWTKNTQQKSSVVLQAMLEQKKDVVWLDADAVVNKPLDFFNLIMNMDFDLSCYFLKSGYNPRELLTGTFYFKNKPIVRQLVSEWNDLNGTVREWDQRVLQTLVDGKYKDKLIIKPLPDDYIKIKPKNVHEDQLTDNTIVHKQLSRANRNSMGNFQKSVQIESIKGFLQNKSIILVGNSQKLLTKERGSFIDGHDCVIRFNHGIPEPKYNKHVGSQTDIWVNAPNKIDSHLENYNKFPKKPHFICRFNSVTYHKKLIDKMYIWNMHYLQVVKNLLQTPNGKNPSTGFTTIWWLKNVVGVKKIKIIGFDGMQSTNFYMTKANRAVSGHEGLKEFRKLKQYQKEGWLEIL